MLVEFGVDGHGHVVAPHVLDAAPEGVFERSALAAVSGWRYEALGTDTSNVQVRLTFRRHDSPMYARGREVREVQRAAAETRSADWVLPVSGPAYPISADVYPSR